MAIEYNGNFLGPEVTGILEEAEDLFDVETGANIAAAVAKVENQTQSSIDAAVVNAAKLNSYSQTILIESLSNNNYSDDIISGDLFEFRVYP